MPGWAISLMNELEKEMNVSLIEVASWSMDFNKLSVKSSSLSSGVWLGPF